MRFLTLELFLATCLAKSDNRDHYWYYSSTPVWDYDYSDSYWPMTISYYEYKLESLLSDIESLFTDTDFICKVQLIKKPFLTTLSFEENTGE